MGAALTYARRYALFTLVGIAGEDDLDAPDLPVSTTDTGSPGRRPPGKMNGHAGDAAGKTEWHRKSQPPKPVLDSQASAMVRDKLGEEIAALDGVEAAVEWAGRSLGAKNTLTAEDAAIVEAAFRERMQVLQPEVYSLTSAASEAPSPPLASQREWPTSPIHQRQHETREPEQRLVREFGWKGTASRPQNPGAAATKTICALLPFSRAQSAVGSLARPITSGSRSQALLAVEYRMSSQSRCAAFIIASFTVLATSARGGTNSISIRFRLRSDFGNRQRACLRGQMANPKLTPQIADVTIGQESEAGASSNSDLPSRSTITDHSGTTR